MEDKPLKEVAVVDIHSVLAEVGKVNFISEMADGSDEFNRAKKLSKHQILTFTSRNHPPPVHSLISFLRGLFNNQTIFTAVTAEFGTTGCFKVLGDFKGGSMDDAEEGILLDHKMLMDQLKNKKGFSPKDKQEAYTRIADIFSPNDPRMIKCLDKEGINLISNAIRYRDPAIVNSRRYWRNTITRDAGERRDRS
jgi:hypothetical protein